MADLRAQRVPVPSHGIDITSAPQEVDNTHGLEVENVLVDRDGMLEVRGPITLPTFSAALSGSPPYNITGIWAFDDKVLIGKANKSDRYQYEPWRACTAGVSSANLAEPYTTTMDYQKIGNLPTTVAGTQNTVIAGRGARLGNYVYGHAYSNATNITTTVNGGDQHRRKILRWDGTAATPTLYANAPDAGQDVIAHLNRLWVLGGIDVPGGLSTLEPNTLFYSDYGGPTADTTAIWQNDVTGITNKIVVDSDDQNDVGIGLARLGQDLVIFKRHSIHVLYGYSDDTFTLRPVAQGVGCIDRRSIVETEHGIYFMSMDGYMLFDGNTVRAVDAPVRRELLSKALVAAGDVANQITAGRCTAIKLANGYLLVAVSRANFDTVVAESGSCCAFLYHTPTGRWTRFSSSIFGDYGVPRELVRTANHIIACDGTHISFLDAVTSPEAIAPTTYRRTVDEDAGGSYAIEVNWWSRPIELSTPLYKAQLHRVLVDYNLVGDFELDGADDDKITLNVYDEDGSLLYGPITLGPITDQSQGEIERMRYVGDAFAEANAIQLRLSWGGYASPSTAGYGNTSGVTQVEFYDCWIEYQESRQRRTVSSG